MWNQSPQSRHLWRYERQRVGEVTCQRVAQSVGEAHHLRRRLPAQRHGRAHALAVQHGNPDDPLPGTAGGGAGLHVCCNLPLPLVPAVLEPDLDLRLGELQRGGQPGSLRAAQVAFQVEGGLQLVDLTPAEHGAGFLLTRQFQVTWEEGRLNWTYQGCWRRRWGCVTDGLGPANRSHRVGPSGDP